MMPPVRVSRAMMVAVMCSIATVGSAQGTDSHATSSTLAGVYTPGQAERGRITYAGMCKSCHSPASHTGATFEKWWKGKSVATLFAFMSSQMPKNNPGSLNPDEYADVVAYLLKMNAMPTGTRELVADSTTLATVLIEMPQKTQRAAKPKATAPAIKPTRKP
ncbi:MAG: cytochrome c [bacterium]